MRQFCGIPRASSFFDLTDTMDVSIVIRLASAYALVYYYYYYLI